MEIGH